MLIAYTADCQQYYDVIGLNIRNKIPYDIIIIFMVHFHQPNNNHIDLLLRAQQPLKTNDVYTQFVAEFIKFKVISSFSCCKRLLARNGCFALQHGILSFAS